MPIFANWRDCWRNLSEHVSLVEPFMVDEWVSCEFMSFQQYFSHIRRTGVIMNG